MAKNKLYKPIQASLIFSNPSLESCFLKRLFVFTLGFSIRTFICFCFYVFFPLALLFGCDLIKKSCQQRANICTMFLTILCRLPCCVRVKSVASFYRLYSRYAFIFMRTITFWKGTFAFQCQSTMCQGFHGKYGNRQPNFHQKFICRTSEIVCCLHFGKLGKEKMTYANTM